MKKFIFLISNVPKNLFKLIIFANIVFVTEYFVKREIIDKV